MFAIVDVAQTQIQLGIMKCDESALTRVLREFQSIIPVFYLSYLRFLLLGFLMGYAEEALIPNWKLWRWWTFMLFKPYLQSSYLSLRNSIRILLHVRPLANVSRVCHICNTIPNCIKFRFAGGRWEVKRCEVRALPIFVNFFDIMPAKWSAIQGARPHKIVAILFVATQHVQFGAWSVASLRGHDRQLIKLNHAIFSWMVLRRQETVWVVNVVLQHFQFVVVLLSYLIMITAKNALLLYRLMTYITFFSIGALHQIVFL